MEMLTYHNPQDQIGLIVVCICQAWQLSLLQVHRVLADNTNTNNNNNKRKKKKKKKKNNKPYSRISALYARILRKKS